MHVTPDHGLICQHQEKDSTCDDYYIEGIGAHGKSARDFYASMKGIDEEDGIGKAGEKYREKNGEDEEHSGQKVSDFTPSPVEEVDQEPEHATEKGSGEENGKGFGKHR